MGSWDEQGITKLTAWHIQLEIHVIVAYFNTNFYTKRVVICSPEHKTTYKASPYNYDGSKKG